MCIRDRVCVIWLCAVPGRGLSQVGCYGSLPTSFSEGDTYAWQSSSHCSDICLGKGAAYMALFNHNECYCGDSSPQGSAVSGDSCDAYCFGYSQEMCGGTDAYLVYSLGDDVGSASGSSSVGGSTTTLSQGCLLYTSRCV